MTDPKTAANVDLNDIRLVKKLPGCIKHPSAVALDHLSRFNPKSISCRATCPLTVTMIVSVAERLGATTDDTELVDGLVLTQKVPGCSD